MTLGNGLAVTNGWGDPATGSVTGDGRLAARRLYRTSDNASLSDLAYSYDADGNIASITDQVNASGSVLWSIHGNSVRKASAAQAIHDWDSLRCNLIHILDHPRSNAPWLVVSNCAKLLKER